MPGDAVGRNDPCPCGSGKKYKKCCLEKESPAERARPLLPRPEREPIRFEADIDKLSNSALDAIEAGRFDEAERLCERLRREYPETLDWHDRYAILREAQGRFEEAADHYAGARDMALRQADGPSAELVEMFEQSRNAALAKAAARR